MALTDDNSMVMPVAPMYGGGNGGFGGGFGGDWGWIILLLLIAGNGGWGFGGGFGGGYDYPMLYSGYESDSGNLSFTRYQTDVPDAFFASGISNRNYWANSTMKIVNRVTDNNNVVWDFYKDGTLAFSTPEFDPDHIAYPFFWDNSEAEKIFVITGNSGELNATITAMKVSYNE